MSKPIPLTAMNFDEIAAQVAASTTGASAPRIVTPTVVTLPVPETAPKPDLLRFMVKVALPLETHEQLKAAVKAKEVTKQYLILKALRDAGYAVSDDALQADGRRAR